MLESRKSDLKQSSQYWSAQAVRSGPKRLRWRESNYLVRCMNERICGRQVGGANRGLHEKLKEMLGDRSLARGVSVGCGRGAKEMTLIQQGLVERFDLYEISDAFIEQGRALAEKRGLADRVQFHKEDAFTHVKAGTADIIHWSDSLHHMPDTHDAVRWSKDRLNKGGIFYMDEYVGPNRFQWSQESLDLANAIRARLPKEIFLSPYDGKAYLHRWVKRPLAEKVIEADPTESGDSEGILPAVGKIFPKAETWITGGAIFRLALNEIIHNLDDEKDATLLGMIAVIDQMAARAGHYHFAAALAVK